MERPEHGEEVVFLALIELISAHAVFHESLMVALEETDFTMVSLLSTPTTLPYPHACSYPR
jgi:hypothetical protein